MPTDKKSRAEYMRTWRAAHPENREYQRKYQERYYLDPAKLAAQRRRAAAWRKAHPERFKETLRKCYLARRVLKGRAVGARHPNWKGDAAKYAALHAWVRRHKGTPDRCEACGAQGQRHHWANVDHCYRRVLEDYRRLCSACHYTYDVAHGFQPALDGRAGGLAAAAARLSVAGP